jgi:hypothetical protein
MKLTTQSPPYTKVMNAWKYTVTPTYVFLVWCLIKQKDSFTFTKAKRFLSFQFTETSYAFAVSLPDFLL